MELLYDLVGFWLEEARERRAQSFTKRVEIEVWDDADPNTFFFHVHVDKDIWEWLENRRGFGDWGMGGESLWDGDNSTSCRM
jgi:hypothetical protein